MGIDSFVSSFLEQHGIKYEEALDSLTGTSNHDTAVEAASSFVENTGNAKLHAKVYGEALDILTADSIAELQNLCADEKEIHKVLLHHKSKLLEEIKNNKQVVIESQVTECVREYKKKPMTLSKDDTSPFPEDTTSKEKELEIHGEIAWIENFINKMD